MCAEVATDNTLHFHPPTVAWLRHRWSTCDALTDLLDEIDPAPWVPCDSFDRYNSEPADWRDVEGDGHCGYRSSSIATACGESKHGIMRKVLSEEILRMLVEQDGEWTRGK